MHQISKTHFKAKALEFFRQIEDSGESVIITDHDKPTLEIRLYRHIDREPLEILRGSVIRYDNPVVPIDVEWEAAQ